MGLDFFPDMDLLKRYERATPAYMHPNHIPYAVIAEGLLTKEECESIQEVIVHQIEGFHHDKCGAFTREIGHMECLDIIRNFAHGINAAYWNYDLDWDSYTWMQEYVAPAGEYQLHMDAGPGRMRKLTAVTFLSDPNDYEGGDLEVHFHPSKRFIPKTQGTVVMFQPWILHQVHPVTSGMRRSLNMSFWGPNFR